MKELLLIQSELNAPKTQWSEFGGYWYRKAEDIYLAAKPLLEKYNCYLYLTDSIVCIEGRHYVCATAVFKNSSGESVTITSYAREEQTKKGMDASQLTGAASSYARKYALSGLFLIDDNIDPDSLPTDDGNKGSKKVAEKTIKADNTKDTDSVEQTDKHKALLKEAKKLLEKSTSPKRVEEGQPLGYVDIWENYEEIQYMSEFSEAVRAARKRIVEGK